MAAKKAKKPTKRSAPKQSTWLLVLGEREFTVTGNMSQHTLDILNRVGEFAQEQCAIAFQAGAHTVEHAIERTVTKLASVPPPAPEQT